MSDRRNRAAARFARLVPVLAMFAFAPGSGVPPAADSQLASPRPLRLIDYGSLVQIDDIAISPDGEWLAYERAVASLEADSWQRSIWAVTSSGTASRQLVGHEGGGQRPRWSPDGKLLGFLSNRESGVQLWLLPLDGGEAWRLTDLPGEVTDFDWSPDASRLVVVSREPVEPAARLLLGPMEMTETQPSTELQDGWQPARAEETTSQQAIESEPGAPLAEPRRRRPQNDNNVATGPAISDVPRVIRHLRFRRRGSAYVDARNRHLHVIDLTETGPGRTAAPRQITSGPYDAVAPRWSPDGRWIAFASNRTPDAETNRNSDLWIVSPDGGEPESLTADPGTESGPVWSPDGRWIAYLYIPASAPMHAGSQVAMVSVTDQEENSSEDAEAALDPGEPVVLSADLDRPMTSGPRWSPDGTSVYVSIQDRGTVPVVRVGTGLDPMGKYSRGGLFRRRRRGDLDDRGVVEPVLAGPRVSGRFELLPEGEAIAVVLSSGSEPQEIFRAPSDVLAEAGVPMQSAAAHIQPSTTPPAAALLRLTRENRGWRQQIALGVPEPLRFPSPDGTEIEGWLLRPPGHLEGMRHPLIVYLHGGWGNPYSWAFSWELQWLVGRGFAVMYANLRGTAGYGLQFAEVEPDQRVDLGLQAVLAGLDHLIERDLVDPDRIGITGTAYGGMLANYLITRSNRFAAAISSPSDTDTYACYGTVDSTRWWEEELGVADDRADRDAFVRLSLPGELEHTKTPTLFLVGDNDSWGALAHSERLYARLRRALGEGAETALVVYPAADGAGCRPSFVVDRWHRFAAWSDRYLNGDLEADPFHGRSAW